MKVAFDGQIFSAQKYGGISRYFARLAGELNSINIPAKIYAGYHINSYLEGSEPFVVGKYLERYPQKTIRLFRKWNELESNFRLNFYQPKLLHETYFSKKPVLKGKVPVFVTVYDMIQEIFPNHFSQNEIHTADKRISLNRANHIISISHHTKKDLCELFNIEESKVSVVHLAADSPIPINSRIPANRKCKMPYFLFVGDRRGYKNFSLFIRAFASSDFLMENFGIVAFGGPGFASNEKKLFVELGFEDHQIEHFYGSDSLLATFYSDAEAFVYPSQYEGFGIPPLEAMSYDCPVICSNTSSIPEVVGDAAITFDPTKKEELQVSLEKLVLDQKLKFDLIQNGRVRFQQFSWRKTAEETLNVYQTIS